MAMIDRPAATRGWVPDADAVNGPVDGLLRADNCIFDELGAVTLRPGAAALYALAGADARSLYTAVLAGTRYRLAASGTAIYSNGSSIATGLSAAADVAFATMCGQVFWAQASIKRKYDGSSVRNWGIAMTGAKPTVAALAADTKTLMSCDTGELPAPVINEGAGAPNPTYADGEDGTADGSIEIEPDTDTGRAVVTKDFGTETDFTTYDSGQTGSDDDLLEFWLYVTEPDTIEKISIMVDVNGDSTNLFQDDYYRFTLQGDTALDLSAISLTAGDYTAEGRTRRRLTNIERDRDGRAWNPDGPVTEFRPDRPESNAGWNKVSVRRGMFKRIGATTGKDWSTVNAIRIVCDMTGGGAEAAVRIDDVHMRGGTERPLTGTYRYRYVYVRNASGYLALSPVSDVSDPVILKAEGTTVTLPADGSRDSQVNEIWVYRMGGDLDAWYRVAVKTSVSGGGGYTQNDTLSDRDALILNIRLETDNIVPPANIVSLEGPYYDRLWALTATTLYPSRKLDPDAFSEGQAITVGDATETAYWVHKALGGLYVGTSKDIYRIDGTAAELPDETIDVIKTGLNVDHPPISAAVARAGNLLVYLADDGWRALSGAGSTLLVGATSLLYKGYTRHGVSPVNLVGGRFRVALVKGQLVAITPEGSSTTSSTVLYRGDLASGRWTRHVYPWSLRSLFAERDGTLLAGDTAGAVRILDSGTTDAGASIPVTLWTTVDHLGMPYSQKDLSDLRIKVDTGGTAGSVAVHLDRSETAAVTQAITQSGLAVTPVSVFAATQAAHLQLRFTLTGSTFRWYGWGVTCVPRPVGVVVWDSGPIDLGSQDLVWLREVQIKVNAAATLTVTPYFDGVAWPASTVAVTANVPTVYSVPIGRGYKGYVPRLVVTSSSPFVPYWLKCRRRETGPQSDKRTVTIPAGVIR